MRKPEEKTKRYYLLRRVKLARRALVSKRKQLERRRSEQCAPKRRRLANTSSRREKAISLDLPETLSLSKNPDATLRFFEQLREYAMRRRKRLKVDFLTLQHVTPGAALVLAAELDRWRVLVTKRLRVFDIDDWNPSVRVLLQDMGLFSLLDVINPPNFDVPETSVKFIRFKAGSLVLGDLAKKLRLSIEQVAGEIPEASTLYDGLTEAMTNVVHHAYPRGVKYETPPIHGQWWMAGSYNRADARLTVMFYDQGKGIPYTLPRTHLPERIGGYLRSIGLGDSDSSRIKAAMHLGRTQTGLRHRGKGLLNIRAFTESSANGLLRILSGKGEYIYRSNGDEELRTLSQSIGGTLIQWEVSLPTPSA